MSRAFNPQTDWNGSSGVEKDINDREHESPPSTRGQSVRAHTLIGEWWGRQFKEKFSLTDSHTLSPKIARFHWDKCAFYAWRTTPQAFYLNLASLPLNFHPFSELNSRVELWDQQIADVLQQQYRCHGSKGNRWHSFLMICLPAAAGVPAEKTLRV